MNVNVNDPNIPTIGQKQPRICESCGRPSHPFNTKCNYADLKSRVKNLLDRNGMIPVLADQNKQVTEMAITFQTQFDNVSKALLLCEKTIMEFENGTQIWKRFQERLEEEWPKKIISPDTEETQEVSNPESTTPNETESKHSTEGIVLGETTVQDSSRLMESVTRAEQEPPLLIT